VTALPELVETVCPACCGTGVDEYVTVGGQDWVEGCVLCGARGVVEVCPFCGETPDAFTDVCGCNQEILYGISVGWLAAA
jgi:hypothetical protein